MDRQHRTLIFALLALMAVSAIAAFFTWAFSDLQTAITSKNGTSGLQNMPASLTYQLHANGSGNIKHIVVIMQENHAFDNYFGTFPGVAGTAYGIPANECMPINASDPNAGCIKPFLIRNPAPYSRPPNPQFYNETMSANIVIAEELAYVLQQNASMYLPSGQYVSLRYGLPHNWTSSHTAWDNGKMDNFIQAENSILTMAYYNNLTIPFYWDFAKNYVLADNFFSSVLSYSLPNHWYALAGQAPNVSIKTLISSSSQQYLKNAYINESNNITTIMDFLENYNLTWKYYDHTLPVNYSDAISTGYMFQNWWNPTAAKSISYSIPYYQNFVNRTNIFADLKGGSLPQVSWVVPTLALSELPPENLTLGMYWTTDVIDAIMASRYWNSTVIILVWDDYGGYYDNVPPPQIGKYGLGFRVPAIIISPYSKAGYIDSTEYSFESILKFIEWKFNLTSLTGGDASANNLINALNFSQAPQPPKMIPMTVNDLMAIAQYVGGNGYPALFNASKAVQHDTYAGSNGIATYGNTAAGAAAQPSNGSTDVATILIAISVASGASAAIVYSRAKQRSRNGSKKRPR
jgi:phospholipase C